MIDFGISDEQRLARIQMTRDLHREVGGKTNNLGDVCIGMAIDYRGIGQFAVLVGLDGVWRLQAVPFGAETVDGLRDTGDGDAIARVQYIFRASCACTRAEDAVAGAVYKDPDNYAYVYLGMARSPADAPRSLADVAVSASLGFRVWEVRPLAIFFGGDGQPGFSRIDVPSPDIIDVALAPLFMARAQSAPTLRKNHLTPVQKAILSDFADELADPDEAEAGPGLNWIEVNDDERRTVVRLALKGYAAMTSGGRNLCFTALGMAAAASFTNEDRALKASGGQ
jgi:hypothetical protein